MSLALQEDREISIPERSVNKLDESHSSITFRMQGATERDQWMRTFPLPMPATHELYYEWDSEMTLTVSVRKKDKGQPVKVKADKPVGDVHDDARAALRVELESKYGQSADPKMENLDSYMAEQGVEQPRKAFGREVTRAQKIAALVDKLIPAK